MLTQFLDMLLVIDNIDDLVNSLIFVSVVAVICKATLVVIRRNAIISLVQILLKEPCKPRDEDEYKENSISLSSRYHVVLCNY